jgi:hypothetical protein
MEDLLTPGVTKKGELNREACDFTVLKIKG